MIYMVMKETGMSWNEVMYERSWINIRMMLADAPRMIKTGGKKRKKIKGLDELPNRR